jgi:hypothetical protein
MHLRRILSLYGVEKEYNNTYMVIFKMICHSGSLEDMLAAADVTRWSRDRPVEGLDDLSKNLAKLATRMTTTRQYDL